MIRLTFLAAATLLLFVFVPPDRALAQIQDAYVEKTYCVDGRGNEIRFLDRNGVFPPDSNGKKGSASIVGDQRMLSEFSYPSRQFLFTRACLKAANLNLGTGGSSKLDCETSRFMMRRFKTRPSDIYEIVTELGRQRETEQIARSLSGC